MSEKNSEICLQLPNLPLDDWLTALKPYQKDTIEVFRKNVGEDADKITELWLSSRGPLDLKPFGGAGNAKPFLDALKVELRKLLCDSKEYKKERAELSALMMSGQNASTALTVAITAYVTKAMAPILGTATPLLLPAIAVMLHTVGKVSVKAWCNSQTAPPTTGV